MDESLIFQLKKYGFSEYEAKVYSVLFSLRVGNAREIHEISGVPRGKVYETLSSLIEKGFIGSSGGNPARFYVSDIAKTFEELRKSAIDSINELYEYLINLEEERPQRFMQAYELQTKWAIESQILLLFRRVREEMIILCSDEEFLARYAAELEKLHRQIMLYIVIENKELATFSPVKCYIGAKDINVIFHPRITEEIGEIKRVIIYADRRDSLSIGKNNGELEGVFLSNDNYAEFFCKTILKNTKPV